MNYNMQTVFYYLCIFDFIFMYSELVYLLCMYQKIKGHVVLGNTYIYRERERDPPNYDLVNGRTD